MQKLTAERGGGPYKYGYAPPPPNFLAAVPFQNAKMGLPIYPNGLRRKLECHFNRGHSQAQQDVCIIRLSGWVQNMGLLGPRPKTEMRTRGRPRDTRRAECPEGLTSQQISAQNGIRNLGPKC